MFFKKSTGWEEGNVGRYKLLSNPHGDFPKNNHKFGPAPIATEILRAWYKMHPPLSIDSFMPDISAFRTFFFDSLFLPMQLFLWAEI